MRALPVFLNVGEAPVIVAGATSFALAKLEILLARGAAVRWHPLTLQPAEAKALLPVHKSGQLAIHRDEIAASDLAAASALVAAVGDGRDARLAKWARELRIPVNVVDRPELSTFTFPAIIDRGDVVVAVGTNGASPVLARRLREQIEALLPARIAELGAFLARQRARLRTKLGRVDRALWEKIIDGPVARHVLEGRLSEAEGLLDQLVAGTVSCHGMVTLVGAGPGDPDLLTLKALHALQQADVIFYDALVTPEILARARRDARKVFVGKRKGGAVTEQADINRLMIMAASAGAHVVRLKGGDPFVFGRGGEEKDALDEAGIAVSVIPGITAALGCAAEAEIPLTFRDEATKLVMLTAHRAGDEVIDWSGAADPKATLVIYMGHSSAAEVRDGLIEAGRSPHTPAAILARGTRPDAVTLAGPLSALPRLAAQAGEGPAILIVGDVVARAKAWRASSAATLAEVA